jgi:hypothetical protein
VFIQCNLVTPPKKWLLHGAILERHSSWFRQTIRITGHDQEHFHPWTFFLLEKHEGEVRLVLQKIKSKSSDTDIDNTGLIIRIETFESSQSAAILTPPAYANSSASEAGSDETTAAEPHAAIVDIYDQILGSFYSPQLRIPSDTINDTLDYCESLVKISDGLKCTQLISTNISTALHQHRRFLYTAISFDPARWLLLSRMLENDAIYTEALIHIIGAHPCWPWPTKRTNLPHEYMKLVIRKSAELDTMCIEAERELLLLTIHIHKFGPVEPQDHSTFSTWFIVQTFRDQFARTFHALEMDRQASLKRGALFRKITKGKDEYMQLGEMRRLMSRIMPSAVGSLEEDLRMLKECASRVVEDVSRNELCLDVEGREKVGYLTCVKIRNEDIPWRAEWTGDDRGGAVQVCRVK